MLDRRRRADENDASPLGALEEGERALHAPHGGHQIRVEHLEPAILARPSTITRIAHYDVDPTERLAGGRDPRAQGIALRDVDCRRHDLSPVPTKVTGCFLQRRVLASADREHRALGGEALRNRAPDAAARPGDHRSLALKS